MYELKKARESDTFESVHLAGKVKHCPYIHMWPPVACGTWCVLLEEEKSLIWLNCSNAGAKLNKLSTKKEEEI